MSTRFGAWWGLVWMCLSWGLNAHGGSNCAPFFDALDNPVWTNVFDESGQRFLWTLADVTPPPPDVDDLDRDFLIVCGGWGAQVQPDAVRSLLDRHPDLLIEPLRSLLPADAMKARDRLVEIWTAKRAFEHIFCGQPKKTRIGGLHFGARYLQLQEAGLICRNTNNAADETLVGRVYTMGINSAKGSDPKKGYALGEHALNIFYEASWTFLRQCTSGSNPSFGCLERSATEPTVLNKFFCAQGQGIITRYSVASGEVMSDRRCEEVPIL